MTHLIIIGFKNAGKSTIGKALSQELKRQFIDLDELIVVLNEKQTGEKMSCRDIMEKHGDARFRKLEHQVLEGIMESEEPLVIALGGGTPMLEENRKLLASHVVIQVSAPKSIVFERIMINGKPAFFPKDREPFESFQQLWNEREPVFRKLASITVENTGTIEEAVKTITKKLHSAEGQFVISNQ